MGWIEVFDEDVVEECLAEVSDCDIKNYAYALLNWAIQKRKVNAVHIPDNATNGDVIRFIFPTIDNYEFKPSYKKDTVIFGFDGFFIRLSADWWNSPYRR